MAKFIAKVRRSGGSLIISIDKTVAEVEKINVGDYVEVDIKKYVRQQQ